MESSDFGNTGSLVVGTVDGVAGINDTTSAADVTVTVKGSGSVLTVNQPITTASSIVVLTGDDMALNAGVSATTSGIVILTPFTIARPMDLGTNAAGTLGLTDAELDRVTAGTLQLGSALPQFAGDVTVTAPITQAGSGYTVSQVNTTAAVISGGGSIAGASLDIFSGAGIGTGGTPLATQVANLDFSNSPSGIVHISNTGSLAITSVAGAGNAVGASDVTINVVGAGSAATINQRITSGGTLIITADGDLIINAPVDAGAGPVVLSSATGRFTAGGTGQVNGGSVTFSDLSNTGHAWTINSASVTVNPGLAIPYTNATAITVNGSGGGDTFGVTPSATTTFNVNKGSAGNPSG